MSATGMANLLVILLCMQPCRLCSDRSCTHPFMLHSVLHVLQPLIRYFPLPSHVLCFWSVQHTPSFTPDNNRVVAGDYSFGAVLRIHLPSLRTVCRALMFHWNPGGFSSVASPVCAFFAHAPFDYLPVQRFCRRILFHPQFHCFHVFLFLFSPPFWTCFFD